MGQTATATTAPLDRWDLIADRLWQIPELGWAIAEANPDLAGYLVLPAGLALVIPELRSLRRPLTAANPAREDDGEFPELPPDTPRPIVPPSGGGSIVLPLAINQGGTGGVSAQDALNNLGAVALSAVGVSVAPLVAGLVPVANLPAFQTPLVFPIAITQGGTGSTTASAALSTLGGIAANQLGVANGIAPLDSNSLVPVANLPPYPTLSSLGAIPTSAIGTTIAPLTSGLVPVSNLPPYPTLTSLGAMPASDRGATNGVAPLVAGLVPVANLPTYPTLASLGGIPLTQKGAANGVAALDTNSLLFISNIPLNTAFPFTNGASFRGGSNPTITPTLVQCTVDSNGLPRHWLVNANAPANSRIKSITVANNGNVQIRHHNDDLSDGNVLEHTASGNVLTNGTLRPGSGAAVFTGASFVPGAIYFRTDITSGSSGTGTLTYSDGTNWMRVSNGSLASSPDPGIMDLSSNQTAGGNKNLTGFTTLGDNIAIKKRKITGTTPATQGSVLNIPTNLDSSKINSFSFLIFFSAKGCMPPNYTFIAAYEYQVYFDIDLCILRLSASNSSGLLSKPFVLIIDYIA